MVEAETEQRTDVAVTFEDMTVLSEAGIDVFVLNWNDSEEVPPYYVDVDGRRFAFTATTFLVIGHSSELPAWVREQEQEGRLPLLVERDGRYLRYVYDPTADVEEDDAEGDAAEGDAAGGDQPA